MLIRYGFDIELALVQPTTVVTLMDIHPSRQGDVVGESGLQCSQSVEIEKFIDSYGNQGRRLTAEAGSLALRLEGIVRDGGRPDETDLSAKATPSARFRPMCFRS